MKGVEMNIRKHTRLIKTTLDLSTLLYRNWHEKSRNSAAQRQQRPEAEIPLAHIHCRLPLHWLTFTPVSPSIGSHSLPSPPPFDARLYFHAKTRVPEAGGVFIPLPWSLKPGCVTPSTSHMEVKPPQLSSSFAVHLRSPHN